MVSVRVFLALFFTVSVLLFGGFGGAALADDTPAFHLPVKCTIGEDCWVVNYMDVDPSENATDFQCRHRTYNNHKGTDIALRDRVSMETGVDVLASAAGTILRFRDGVEDWPPVDTDESIKARKDMMEQSKGCGNGVFMEHAGGWKTIYCHLKEGSIVVKKGEKIKAGQKIGQVGRSGYSEFPHVHMGLYHNDKVIDPFTGKGSEDGCGMYEAMLWHRDAGLSYQPVAVYGAGFADKKPEFDAIKIDATSPKTIAADAEVLTFWVAMYGPQSGDKISIEVLDPLGNMFVRRDIDQEKDRARQFYFVGKRAPEKGLIAGVYQGFIKIIRIDGNQDPVTIRFNETVIVQ